MQFFDEKTRLIRVSDDCRIDMNKDEDDTYSLSSMPQEVINEIITHSENPLITTAKLGQLNREMKKLIENTGIGKELLRAKNTEAFAKWIEEKTENPRIHMPVMSCYLIFFLASMIFAIEETLRRERLLLWFPPQAMFAIPGILALVGLCFLIATRPIQEAKDEASQIRDKIDPMSR